MKRIPLWLWEASEAGCNQEDSGGDGCLRRAARRRDGKTSISCALRVTAAEATRELKRLQVTCGYLLGMVRRRNPEVEKLIDRVKEDAWIDCPEGSMLKRRCRLPACACRRCRVTERVRLVVS